MMTKQPKNIPFDLTTLPEFDNHTAVIGVSDTTIGLQGWISVHSVSLGPALGGTRFLAYESAEEALRDSLNLSRAMSYKCAMAGMQFGGGKGVMMYHPQLDRRQVLSRYAQVVDELRGLFKTGTDVGVSDADVVAMGEKTRHMLGLSPGDRGGLSTSSTAALGVYNAIKATCEYLYGRKSVEGVRISIKGVGKLGGELAVLLSLDGAILTVADIDNAQVERLQERLTIKAKVCDIDEIRTMPTQIYAPCALGAEFSVDAVRVVQAEAIVGGANNQLESELVGDLLWKKGVLYAPDYIANAGGLIYVADELEEGGFDLERVQRRVSNIADTLVGVYESASDLNMSTDRVAIDIAKKRIGQ